MVSGRKAARPCSKLLRWCVLLPQCGQSPFRHRKAHRKCSLLCSVAGGSFLIKETPKSILARPATLAVIVLPNRSIIAINQGWIIYGPDSTAAAWEVQHWPGEESSSKWGLVSGQYSSFSPSAQSRSWWSVSVARRNIVVAPPFEIIKDSFNDISLTPCGRPAHATPGDSWVCGQSSQSSSLATARTDWPCDCDTNGKASSGMKKYTPVRPFIIDV
jgi:hypothetical protein